MDFNRELSELLGQIMNDAAIERGDSMVYKLKPGQRMYHYYGTVGGRTQYCYTPHRDTNGDYWAFNRVRIFYNPKAKLGELVARYKMTKKVKCAKRSTAQRKALRRYHSALAASEKRKLKLAA